MTVLTRRLGRSNLQVSALGLGCWAIGGAMAAGDQPLGYARVDDAEAVRALRRAVELGVTLFDTADAYGASHSERLLATVLADHPEVLVVTKFGNTIDEATRQLTGVDTAPAYVRRALGGSLGALGRDRIDLYQLHTSDVSRERAEELLAALEDLVGEGLIGWYGVSTDDPALAEVFAAGAHCTAMQLQLNVLDDNPDMLAVCDRHDLAALCRSPLAMGLLGGRYTAASTLPADDIRGRQPEWLRWFSDGRPNPDFLRRIDAVPGCSPRTARRVHKARVAGSGPTPSGPSRCPASATPPRSRRTSVRCATGPSAPPSTRQSNAPSAANPNDRLHL
jgi:aryl-alcohol dehydrogenase-like predicted oxidoreductase